MTPAVWAAAARALAAQLTRDISTHHRDCADCARIARGRGPRVVVRGRLAVEQCAHERALFAQLDTAQQEGWPA